MTDLLPAALLTGLIAVLAWLVHDMITRPDDWTEDDEEDMF